MNSTLSSEKCYWASDPPRIQTSLVSPAWVPCTPKNSPSEATFQDKMQSFNRTQRVKFVGGEGIVRNFKFEGGTWLYLVEMDLGPAPKFGRVGAETMVLLDGIDLCAA
jgi:hypothetical protein